MADTTRSLAEIEKAANESLMAWRVNVNARSCTLLESLTAKFSERAQKIFGQIAPHLADVKQSIIDVGCGDGQITQMIADDSKAR